MISTGAGRRASSMPEEAPGDGVEEPGDASRDSTAENLIISPPPRQRRSRCLFSLFMGMFFMMTCVVATPLLVVLAQGHGILSSRHRNNETTPPAELNLARIPSSVVSFPSNTQSSSSYKIVDLTSPSRPRKTHAIPVSNAHVVRRRSQARDRAYAPDVVSTPMPTDTTRKEIQVQAITEQRFLAVQNGVMSKLRANNNLIRPRRLRRRMPTKALPEIAVSADGTSTSVISSDDSRSSLSPTLKSVTTLSHSHLDTGATIKGKQVVRNVHGVRIIRKFKNGDEAPHHSIKIRHNWLRKKTKLPSKNSSNVTSIREKQSTAGSGQEASHVRVGIELSSVSNSWPLPKVSKQRQNAYYSRASEASISSVSCSKGQSEGTSNEDSKRAHHENSEEGKSNGARKIFSVTKEITVLRNRTHPSFHATASVLRNEVSGENYTMIWAEKIKVSRKNIPDSLSKNKSDRNKTVNKSSITGFRNILSMKTQGYGKLLRTIKTTEQSSEGENELRLNSQNSTKAISSKIIDVSKFSVQSSYINNLVTRTALANEKIEKGSAGKPLLQNSVTTRTKLKLEKLKAATVPVAQGSKESIPGKHSPNTATVKNVGDEVRNQNINQGFKGTSERSGSAKTYGTSNVIVLTNSTGSTTRLDFIPGLKDNISNVETPKRKFDGNVFEATADTSDVLTKSGAQSTGCTRASVESRKHYTATEENGTTSLTRKDGATNDIQTYSRNLEVSTEKSQTFLKFRELVSKLPTTIPAIDLTIGSSSFYAERFTQNVNNAGKDQLLPSINSTDDDDDDDDGDRQYNDDADEGRFTNREIFNEGVPIEEQARLGAGYTQSRPTSRPLSMDTFLNGKAVRNDLFNARSLPVVSTHNSTSDIATIEVASSAEATTIKESEIMNNSRTLEASLSTAAQQSASYAMYVKSTSIEEDDLVWRTIEPRKIKRTTSNLFTIMNTSGSSTVPSSPAAPKSSTSLFTRNSSLPELNSSAMFTSSSAAMSKMGNVSDYYDDVNGSFSNDTTSSNTLQRRRSHRDTGVATEDTTRKDDLFVTNNYYDEESPANAFETTKDENEAQYNDSPEGNAIDDLFF